MANFLKEPAKKEKRNLPKTKDPQITRRLESVMLMRNLVIKGLKQGLGPAEIIIAKQRVREIRTGKYALREKDARQFIEGLRRAIVGTLGRKVADAVKQGFEAKNAAYVKEPARELELAMQELGYGKAERTKVFSAILGREDMKFIKNRANDDYHAGLLSKLNNYLTDGKVGVGDKNRVRGVLRAHLKEHFGSGYKEVKELDTLANALLKHEGGRDIKALGSRVPLILKTIPKGGVEATIADLHAALVKPPSEAEILAKMEEVEKGAAEYFRKNKKA